jgi:uncharacterized membrane protein
LYTQKGRLPSYITSNRPSVRIARVAIFTAVAVVGSFIKPNPASSIAFDSFAGFFVALYFGAAEGALVCGFGHLATAVVSGFPLGILHLPIALGMALAGAGIGLTNKLHRWAFIPALAVGVTINTIMVFPLIPWLGATLNEGAVIAVALAPTLALVAALNAVAAGVVFVALRGTAKT